MKFTTTLRQFGGTATGIEVPEEVVTGLGQGRRVKVVATVNGYSYRTSVAPYMGRIMMPFSSEHRAASGLQGGETIEVELVVDDAPREVVVSCGAGLLRWPLVHQPAGVRPLDRGGEESRDSIHSGGDGGRDAAREADPGVTRPAGPASSSVAAPRLLVVSDMDGTLTTAEAWRAVLAWLAEHRPTLAGRRFVAVRLPLVLLVGLRLVDKEWFRARWLHDLAGLLRGMTVDELAAMADWVVTRHLWPARREMAIAAVAQALAAARREDERAELVLATGAFQPIADAFARRMDARLALGTPLELRDGIGTGRLSAPVGSGVQKAASVRTYAGEGRVVAAFGDTAADVPLLELADRPVAVAPDRALLAVARGKGWELLAE